MTADELISTLEENESTVIDGIPYCVIDPDDRTIAVPESEKFFGVTNDKDVERRYFICPKVVGDNIDLSQHQIYVAYAYVSNETTIPKISDGLYNCEDVEVSGDNITFSWKLSDNVFAMAGFIVFKVMAKKMDDNILKTKWNTLPAYGTVLMTLPDGTQIESQYPDILTQILDRLDILEQGSGSGTVDPEQIKQAVNGYLEENPVSGMTAEQEQQLNQNTSDVADLKSAIKNNSEKIDSLSEEIANKTGTGLSKEAIDKLEEVGNYLAYTTVNGGSKWKELISILRNVGISNSADLWEVGGIQPTGTGTTSANRLRTVATLPYEVKKISVDDGYSYVLVVYSEAQTEVPTDTNTVLLTGKGYYNPNGISGNVSTDSFLVSSGTYFNGELLISEVRANINSIYGSTAGDRAHFRILLKNNDDTTLTADDGLHIHLWG